MKEISKQEADSLIGLKQAGWYAVYSNPPILHESQYVVETSGKFFLASKEEFDITPVGILHISGIRPKMGHSVAVNNEELVSLLSVEIKKIPRAFLTERN